MAKITRKDVEYVARLARLELTDAEKEKFTVQLEKILDYIDQLNKLDTKDTPPTSHVLPLKNVWRKDELSQCSGEIREALLKNAPDREGNFFKVKKVIE
ncbi:MAG: Asp-tRNA(Asn)/Glu-tRNA(Gln) amidotransferase subunit GatC [Endomicrobiales bacterium]|nr:Asp-tRNA(Asn)/Glu-tRNA(Gln) amidotransferase subunit GatC [Endomicrobiales bacterium]